MWGVGKRGTLSSFVNILAFLIAVLRKLEQVVANAANLHVANLDSGMENAQLNAHADRIAVFLVQQAASLLNAPNALLGFQRCSSPPLSP